MKKLLLMVLFVGFGISNGIAQNKVKCTASTTKSKKIVKKHKVVKKQATKPVYVVRSVQEPIAPAPCTGYRKHNIVVTECPGLMFDQDDRIEATSYRNYSGYLPKQTTVNIPAKDGLIAPQSPNVWKKDDVVAPGSGNFR